MTSPSPLFLDFETEAINGNASLRPPKPVGLAYYHMGEQPKYLAWGHASRNNQAGPGAAINIIRAAIDNGEELCFHHGKFDTSVAEEHLGIVFPSDPLVIHDTLFMVFLHDPYAERFGLKESAERILGILPDERDALRAWILSHVDCKPSEWGAHIARAPGDLAGSYAIGDVIRTANLYERLVGSVPLAAYQREQRLMPITKKGERRGVRVDCDKLWDDMAIYEQVLEEVDGGLRKILKSPLVNLDSNEELADALERGGAVKIWVKTPGGRRSISRPNLEISIADPGLRGLLAYRNTLSHCLSSFGRPWMQLASEYEGRLHPEWNQVRQERDANKSKGTRTGRLSCMKPNLQNPPNVYEREIPEGLPDLPLMRRYLIPDEGYVWLKRDYSQQELRILAHYSEGRLYQRYQEDPRIDAHVETSALITQYTGLELPRKHVKITGFSIIYGSGIPHLSSALGVSMDEAGSTKSAYFAALPEVKVLMDQCKRRGYHNQSIMTWGGREYYVEPPKIMKPKKGGVPSRRTFEYKLLNYLIQGSAADCTKEALIRWDEDLGNGEFLATLHDEIDGQAPIETAAEDMEKLRVAMESIEFDVQMLSDGFYGDNWAELEECQ